ncbi:MULTISPECIES: helix-turn-helix transcriptional regulator [Micromonospora]|uniref:XRE family transcriptional regulator n=1 Tax=Micromonospora solifontis TaxID=2487138 RepID=A0ABX9WC75_9ACTN|nr:MULTISPECIES: helix-turn-helix transcriptional regulator [Micromonospora]NES15387.1 helix-turn-helix transcriptional regulator [Micromonospora sp. PPF5-17B]NES39535.1 helix-turn-helix transcriptional regulator [Micromonospora solifontis]NES56735.1 helix-turn-helix transcriptional regulator [Micromonospora sp. PPF5-6]RNL88338.1 XRE family transcriptional regulator [Micromonospora solifontis]
MNGDMWIRALKAARAGAGVSQEALAELIRWSPSTIAAIETGRRRPTPQFAEAADAALDTNGLLAELLAVAARQESPAWFAPWRGIEAEAVALRTSQPSLVPGLLQTEAYAHAVLRAQGTHRPEQVDQLVAARLARQELLTGPTPTRFTAVVDETALRRVVGGRDVQRAQLERLLELAALPHVRLYAVPAEAGAHPGLAGGFVLATLAGGDEVAYVDGVFGQVVDRPDALDTIRTMWDTLLSEALPAGVSVELIGKLVSEL